jgi:hypothetical protein
MTTLNFNTSSNAGSVVEVWSDQAIDDRREMAIFEYLKDYSNAIVRQDDPGLRTKYPSPSEAYKMTYHNKAKLIGAGVTNQASLTGKEEKVRKNTFSYTAQFRRHAVANDEYIPNADISEADYMLDQRSLLSEWNANDKQNQDISRMMSGAVLKKYGNGAVGAFASITSSHVLDDDSFVVLKKTLAQYNASPVWMSDDSENGNKFRGYVMLVDETVAEALLASDDFSAFLETFFEGHGWESPLSKIAYGKKQNMAIIPVEPKVGFGSPLRPELIIAKDTASLANNANVDLTVGIPTFDPDTGTYDDYTNDTAGVIEFTQYLTDYMASAGATSAGVLCKIVQADGTLITGVTIKLGSSATSYTINVANASGGAIVLKAGDRIIVLSSAVMALGAKAYISHQSAPYFTGQNYDYNFEQGIGVNYWEGGVLVKDTQNIANNIVLDFVYAS